MLPARTVGGRRSALTAVFSCFRVFSENRCFLLVLFGSTHRAPQFFQCRGREPGPGAQLDYQLLAASQCVTLYQVTLQQLQSVKGTPP